ncbi:hypothetical protein KNP414_01193 [Paenibacillus mucilaginosus KNP414]|uniref:Uncharacterized protein n=1 Tax=Paenibacillus mucilaginosus (strain KNP414) TaxID=1036673 RepID=F8FF60_PAEMK|nr:hypothetical protein KNP414_01193 [Paenibacillus mucilaginosus KNP414]
MIKGKPFRFSNFPEFLAKVHKLSPLMEYFNTKFTFVIDKDK